MKKNIHPINNLINVKCSCGNNIKIFSVLKNDIFIDVCYKCHSFYTGKNKISNKKGRLEMFKKRYGKNKFFFI